MRYNPACSNPRVNRAAPLRLSAVLILSALLAPRAQADDEQDEISFHAGKMSMTTGKATAAGSAHGLRYLHSRTPFIGLGLDVDFLRPEDENSDKVIANGNALTSIDSASVLGVMRLGPTEETLRPYFLVGLGMHFSTVRIEAAPNPGYGWADTMTAEKRTLIDASAKAAAIKIQGGADYAITDNFLAGLFLAWNHMGSAKYEATEQAKSLGIDSVSGTMSAITFGINLVGRF